MGAHELSAAFTVDAGSQAFKCFCFHAFRSLTERELSAKRGLGVGSDLKRIPGLDLLSEVPHELSVFEAVSRESRTQRSG